MKPDLPQNSYTVKPVKWDSPEAELVKTIRFAVFVDEQKVPAELELDEVDPTAFHVLALDEQGLPCGTGRLFPKAEEPSTAKIGRMAVLAGYRGSGCGRALLSALLAEAKLRGYSQAALSAQAHAVPFYEKHGFRVQGDVYDDAGIPHYWMQREL